MNTPDTTPTQWESDEDEERLDICEACGHWHWNFRQSAVLLSIQSATLGITISICMYFVCKFLL